MIDSEAIAPTRAAGTDYAASHRHGHAKQLRHDAALAIVGLPCADCRFDGRPIYSARFSLL